MINDKFMESFKDFKKSYSIAESEKEADDNIKIKETMEKAKDAKLKAQGAKEEYEKLQSEKAKDSFIEIALLNYKKFKAEAEMLAAEAKLIKKGISLSDEKPEPKK
jgi:hypothetical protein